MEIVGAEDVRLKFDSTFGAKRLDAELLFEDGALNVKGEDGDATDGEPKGFTGVGPVPNEIDPFGFSPFPLRSMRVGLSSMFIPSSGLEGGVTGL